ncbi:MAG TPA: outer membrane lipoprotein carrier protein LolA, partial [Geobacteraceae bacterium]
DGRDAGGNYVLELQPRRSTAFINKIFMVVRLESVLNFAKNRANFMFTATRNELLFPVLSTTVIDHQGNTTTMEFTNIKVNSRLSSSFFNFMIPPGAQVVRPPTAAAPGR